MGQRVQRYHVQHQPGFYRPLYFIVLMNGKVIPAIREPESIK